MLLPRQPFIDLKCSSGIWGLGVVGEGWTLGVIVGPLCLTIRFGDLF